MGPIRVLVVEDRRDQAESVCMVLNLYMIDAEHVPTLADALDRLSREGIRCVTLDLSLPDARDTEAVERLQAERSSVPIVVLTAHADLIIPAIRAGAQEALLKPYDPEALVQSIRNAIARHEVRGRYEKYVMAGEAVLSRIEQQAALPDPPKGK